MSKPGFEEMYRAEHPKLVALGLALSGDRELAKELAQETLTRAFRDWQRVGSYDIPQAWLRRVLINLATDGHRKSSNERRAFGRMRTQEAVAAPDPVTDSWWIAVRALPERQRAAVVLHYIDDMSVESVAHVLEIAPGTVKASLSKARETLGRTLQQEAS